MWLETDSYGLQGYQNTLWIFNSKDDLVSVLTKYWSMGGKKQVNSPPSK